MKFKNLIVVTSILFTMCSCAPKQAVVVAPQKRVIRTVVVRPVPPRTIVVVPAPKPKPTVVVTKTVVVRTINR